MKIYQVDAFTDQLFSGNSAAVCMMSDEMDSSLMQQIAMEMNLAETAFLQKKDAGFDLRWFTPAIEVDLCGHATLASAHVLWESGLLSKETTAEFYTRSGVLKATLAADGITLDFPAQPPEPIDAPRALIDSLNVNPVYAGYNGTDYLLAVADEETVTSLTPDFRQMREVDMRGVIVTALSNNPNVDFMSRFFAPAAGINEDPVTGSAHCCLGPYWGGQLGKTTMQAYQASPRGGKLQVTLADDRVLLTGNAVTVLEGKLLLK
ncbi:MAG: PhzF family phenazine biosynthesis protein [Rhodothermales bacterium]